MHHPDILESVQESDFLLSHWLFKGIFLLVVVFIHQIVPLLHLSCFFHFVPLASSVAPREAVAAREVDLLVRGESINSVGIVQGPLVRPALSLRRDQVEVGKLLGARLEKPCDDTLV